MKKLYIAAPLVLALAACQAPQKITSEPVSATIIRDISDRTTGKTSSVTVRAYHANPEGETGPMQEIVGAKCDVRSDDLQASVITPQEVIVPKYKQRREFDNRGVPSALVVRCSYDGKSGAAQVTATAKQTTTAGGSVAAVLISAAVTSAVASSTPWVYVPFATVVME